MARDELIPIHGCPVHSPRVRESVRLLSRRLPPGPEFPMAYYVQSGAQATLVLKTARIPDSGWLNRDFRLRLERTGMEGLWLHLHPSAGRRMFTKNGWRLVWGKPRSVDRNGLRYGPSAFQQLIPELYQHALESAAAFLAPAENDSVVDLYCGTGNTLARWIEHGARVVGVEMGGEAVECARHNAVSATILRGKCRHRIPQLGSWIGGPRGGSGRRLLYVNPPRTGIEPEVLNWLTDELRPHRIAYLSCSAGTLSRDLHVMNNAGYRVEAITPYDFFPQTHHVETLALLQRSDNGGTVAPAEWDRAR
jgi:tRNA/tmRNA/rRNA uracil-C5-methylase (TrmA/RlmC/RlmD family)